jgi:uncharacterized protein (TIGR02145 family)
MSPPQYWLSANDAYASVLKLHNAGYLLAASGVLSSRGTVGEYWSSTQYTSNTNYGYHLYFYSAGCAVTYDLKANAFSVRCIKD